MESRSNIPDEPDERLDSLPNSRVSHCNAARHAMGGTSTVMMMIVTHVVMVLSTVVVWKLAVLNWGTDQLGEYLLARRVINVIQFPLICVTQLGLIRFGSMAWARNDLHQSHAWNASATLIAAALSVVSLACLNANPELWAYWLFGIPGGAALVRSSSIAVVGMLMFSVAWSQYWARMSVVAACVLQMLVLVAAPLLLLLRPDLNVSQAVLALGLVWIVISGAAILLQLSNLRTIRLQWPAIRAASLQLVRYGLPRTPGGLAAAALFSVPVIMATRDGNLQAATFMGTGISLLSMTATLIKPFTQAVLPTASRMLAARDLNALRSAITTFAFVGLSIALIVVAAAAVVLPPALVSYLGPEFLQATGLIRVLLLSVAPFTMFVLLRDFLDALDDRPLNARNQILSLVAFFVIAYPGGGSIRIAAALSAAMLLLAILTVGDVYRVLAHLTKSTSENEIDVGGCGISTGAAMPPRKSSLAA